MFITILEKTEGTYDRKHSCGFDFKKGATVLRKDFLRKKRKGGKLDAKWLGSYTIIASLGKGFYSLQSDRDPSNTIKRIYGAHLKPCNPPLKSDVSSGLPP